MKSCADRSRAGEPRTLSTLIGAECQLHRAGPQAGTELFAPVRVRSRQAVRCRCSI